MKIVSSVPGRVRFKDEGMYRNEELSQVICYYMKSVNGVQDTKANPVTGSLVIIYDPEIIGAECLEAELHCLREARTEVLEYLHERLGEYLGKKYQFSRVKFRMGLFGAIYLLYKVKQWLYGKFPLANSLLLLEVAALVTIVGSYPSLRNLLTSELGAKQDSKDLAAQERVVNQYETILTLVGITLTLFREGSKGILLLLLKASTDYFQIRSELEMKKTLLTKNLSILLMLRAKNGDEEEMKPLQWLKKGDTLVFRANDPVLVYGRVVDGTAKVTCSYQSGQSRISTVQKGDCVEEGQMIVQGEVLVEILRLGGFSTKVATPVQDLQLWQQMRSYQEKALYAAAPLAFVGYLISGSLVTSLAVLLVMNPAASELALTSSLTHYLKRLHCKKIIVKNIHAMETLAQVNWAIFDKTGTLTEVEVRHDKENNCYLYERLNPQAEKVVEELHKLNIEHVTIVSGDEHEKVRKVAKQMGIQDYYGKFSSEQKANLIKDNRQAKGLVLMVGDGVNDLLAMQNADVSIAYGECGHALLQADYLVPANQLELIPEIITFTQHSYRLIQQNLVFNQFYAIGVGFMSMLGYIDLFQAESINVINSIWSVWNGMSISVKGIEDFHEFCNSFKGEEGLEIPPDCIRFL